MMEDDDSDESVYEMGSQALPVAAFDIDSVDPEAMPLTSQDYLQQVIAERSKLPKVVTATVPELKLDNIKKSNICYFPIEETIPSEHCPSKEWQNEQISNFSNLRYRIECNREELVEGKKQAFPGSKDQWFEYLFNDDSAEERVRQLPYLDIVMAMSNEMMERVIKLIVDWIVEDKVAVYDAGIWLFALLACIEAPLCIKLMTRLRLFVKKCREIREQLNLCSEENTKELNALNLFICLIGKYFGQHDLSD